jgi:hypothetical protein
MDILNWLYLAKNKFIRTAPSSDKDLLVLGAKVGFNKRGDLYQNYAMSVNDLATYVNESAAGNCPIQMNFKPGSIGEKVSFTKVSGSDPEIYKDVIIPGLLEITRDNGGGGIYNIAQEGNFNGGVSPINTEWTTQYLDPTNTGWTPLWDLTSRTYDNWRNAIETPSGDPAPPMYVGLPAVMKYDDGAIIKYYLILFTEWGVGNENQYGFAYDRYEILDSVFFEQPSADNTTTPQVIDIISDGVQITRSYEGGALYNPLFESQGVNYGASPANTRWNSEFTDSRAGYSGFDDLSNLESRIYTAFIQALDANIGQNLPGTDLIMHDVTTDLYYKVEFDTWAQGCGGGGDIGDIGVGGVADYDITNPGSGYPDSNYHITGVGGNGTDLELYVSVSGGIPAIIDGNSDFGQNYQVGDIITFPYPGVTDVFTIEVTEICSQGGFAYTRTVIPQSCGVKFADGTIMNTAVTAGGAAGTEMNYVTGLLSPQVESDFIALPDTITDDGGTTYKTYKLGGIANFNAPGTTAYSYLIGVISGDSNLKMINDATVIGANGVTTYTGVSGKFTVNALVKDASTGAAIPLTFATIVLDNTIAGSNDYFVSIVATAGASWSGTAYIDIEFMSDQTLSYYN